MNLIIIPVFFQVLLTFVILFSLGYLRFRSVSQRTVHPKDYVLMTGRENWPVAIQRLGRSFQNQLEVPMLFYVLALFIVVTGLQSPTLLFMAWVYVGLRYVHAFIHIIFNTVLYRFSVFLLSTILLLVMWLQFFILILMQ